MAAAFTKKLPGMIINRGKKSQGNVKLWTVLYEYFIHLNNPKLTLSIWCIIHWLKALFQVLKVYIKTRNLHLLWHSLKKLTIAFSLPSLLPSPPPLHFIILSNNIVFNYHNKIYCCQLPSYFKMCPQGNYWQKQFIQWWSHFPLGMFTSFSFMADIVWAFCLH